ncbi:putative glycerophosphoinositol permease [Clavispora lusitaniae]|uniref:Glycerophosphoinositol permease n=1 Tax=Clavispora lusitaniae TaxID=36911 RepID=A0ACD0WDG4_CLALS|nr:putative glycerophosphoinositol permease [Clavispora lusitaniae]QFZ31276.1 putative glycerophosphoinositol permease [Clavispora lusitaniae]QFZ36944.1 putative glycerophosphoinositol permease [Clavispora lusitaniae]QFZ42628.1 putative glycerophosphoinositol permease [Clavispora lusitaniae]QFZ48304.1 putative glycerophosphoinositol permease [Clavispora lusitaniae]
MSSNSTDFEKEIANANEVTVSDPFHYDEEERKNRLSKRKRAADIFTIVCSGFALISDGYQNNVMTMLNTLFATLYPKEYGTNMKTNVSNASLVGTIFGQVIIGILSDRMNRKQAVVIATLFLVFGTIMCAASHGKSVNGMFWMLIIFRGVTGFGIGAEYPSCSVSANEAANETVRRRGGVFCLVTNLPLSFGGPFALIIFLIVYQITGTKDSLWRTMFAIGAFWPLSVFYFRYKMATSELFKKSAIRKNVPYFLAVKYYWRRLLGTCLCWFLYDFVTFPNGIFSGTIISSVLKGKDKKNMEKIAEWNLLLGIIAIPGVIVGAYLCDKIGRRNTLALGFSGYIVFGLIIGCSFDKIKDITGLFIVFYGLMMSMGNLGPGDMMGLTSSECFATPVRGTFYGFSAAIGKVGAVVGTKSFTPIQNNIGKKWTFIIAAICGLLGVATALLCIPQLTDDDLMKEDINFKNYLVQHGWTGHFGFEEELDSVNTNSDEDVEKENIVAEPSKK